MEEEETREGKAEQDDLRIQPSVWEVQSQFNLHNNCGEFSNSIRSGEVPGKSNLEGSKVPGFNVGSAGRLRLGSRAWVRSGVNASAVFPIQTQLSELPAHGHEVPNLQALRVHAHREIAAAGIKGEREHSGGQEKPRFERPRFVKTGGAKILGEPDGTAIRFKEHSNNSDADEVGGRARSLPACRAPKLHLPARGYGDFVLQRREANARDADLIGKPGDEFDSGQPIHVQYRSEGAVDCQPAGVG